MIWKILSHIYCFLLTFYMSLSVDGKNTDAIRLAKTIYCSQNTHSERSIFNSVDTVSEGNTYACMYHTIHPRYSMIMSDIHSYASMSPFLIRILQLSHNLFNPSSTVGN